MADKMMRIAGRSEDGLATPLLTDDVGKQMMLSEGYIKETAMMDGANAPISIEGGEEYSLPIVDWNSEPSSNVQYSFRMGDGYPTFSKNGFYRMEWRSSNREEAEHFERIYASTGRLNDVRLKGTDFQKPMTKILNQTGKFNKLVITNLSDRPITIRAMFKYNLGDTVRSESESYGEHISINETASAEEETVQFAVNKVLFLTNDGDSDIQFNFNRKLNEAGSFTLKAGESLNNVDLIINSISFASNDNQPFRLLGVY